MENITTEMLKITPNNPNMLCGIFAIIAGVILLYVVLWVKFNYDRKARLIELGRRLDQMHNARVAKAMKEKHAKASQLPPVVWR